MAAKVFDHAIQHLEDAQQANTDLIDSNADVLSIYGSCLHSKARLVDNQSQSENNPAKAYVEKAIELLVKAEELQDEDGDAKTLEVVRILARFFIVMFVMELTRVYERSANAINADLYCGIIVGAGVSDVDRLYCGRRYHDGAFRRRNRKAFACLGLGSW